MEQGRQRMLQKWAEPAWGEGINLQQAMSEAARGPSGPAAQATTSGAGTLSSSAPSGAANPGPSAPAPVDTGVSHSCQLKWSFIIYLQLIQLSIC